MILRATDLAGLRQLLLEMSDLNHPTKPESNCAQHNCNMQSACEQRTEVQLWF